MAKPQPLPPVCPQSCPLCGGGLERIGLHAASTSLHVGGSGLISASYYRPGKAFALKSPLLAVACVDCGHVLTFLANRGILPDAK